jgi:DNA-binding beta-propeller fold protein YncE
MVAAVRIVSCGSSSDTAEEWPSATLRVAPNPLNVAFGANGQLLFVASAGPRGELDRPVGDGTVSIIDRQGGRFVLLRSVSVPPEPAAIALVDSQVAVLSRGTLASPGEWEGPGTLTLLDSGDGGLVAAIPVGSGPRAVVEMPGQRGAIVLNEGASPGEGSIDLIDVGSARVTESVTVGSYPVAVAASDDHRTAFVGNLVSNTISVVDLDSARAVRTFRIGDPPGTIIDIALPGGSGVLFVLSRGDARAVVEPSLALLRAEDGEVVTSRSAELIQGLEANGVGGVIVYGSYSQRSQVQSLDATGTALWSAMLDARPVQVIVNAIAHEVLVLARDPASIWVLEATTGKVECVVPVDLTAPVGFALSQTARLVAVIGEPDLLQVLPVSCS